MPKLPSLHRPRRIALAVLAALAPLSPPARALDVTWTGGAPIFFWYDATNRFNPSGEVADALDCAGINNAGRLTCDTLSFWGYAGNWGGTLPGAGDDVHITSTAQVNVELWGSPIRGTTAAQPGGVYNSISQGGGGSLFLANGYSLHTLGASIDRLQLGGKILIDGQGFINQLANVAGAVFPSSGVIGGTGATLVHAGTGFGLADSQHVTFDGAASAGASFTLYDDAVLTNRGNLTGGLTINNYGSTHGGNGYSAVRSFENLGALSLSTATGLSPRIEIDTLLRNKASIDIGTNGYLYAMAGGEHNGSASFAGGAQSQMQFAGYHRFAAGSSISSSGTVTFGGAFVSELPYAPYADAWGFYNDVGASYRAGKTVLLNNAVFSSTADPGELVATGGRAYFNGPGRVQVTKATLTNGALYGTAAVDVAGPLLVQGNSGIGTAGGLRALGGITFDGGNAYIGFYGAATSVENHGLAELRSGTLQFATQATFANLAGATFDLQGDFNISGTGTASGALVSLFDNAGVFRKSAGTGVATITAAFNNRGSVEVQSGTLRLLGGGTHSGSFAQAASLDFGGVHVFTGNTTLGADVGFYGDTTLTVAAGATLTSQSLSLHQRAQSGTVALVNHGSFANLGSGWSHVDTLTNTGSLSNASGTLAADSVTNRGSLSNSGGLSGSALLNDGGLLTASAGSQIDMGQLSNINGGVISNAGTMSTVNLINGVGASLVNSGSFEISYSATPLQLQNLGNINNTASGTFTLDNSTLYVGQFRNDGQFVNQAGTVWLRSGDVMTGQGSFVQYDGLTRVDGRLNQAGGIDIEGGKLAGLGQFNGPVTIGASGQITPGNSPGTLTINGDVNFTGQVYYDPSLHPQMVIEVVDPVVHDRLVVNGAVSFNASANDNLHMVTIKWEGAAPPDLDDAGLTWLTASGGITNGDYVSYTVEGLGAEWQAQVANDGSSLSLSFANSLAYQIQAAGQYGWWNQGAIQIAAGDYAYNLANGFVNSDTVNNAGRFYNRVGAALYNADVGTLTNGAQAFMQNRGLLNSDGVIDNAGTFVNHADGTFTSGNDYGNGGSAQVVNRAGASMTNNGSWSNASNSTLLNQGAFINAASLQNNGTINNDGGSFQVTSAGQLQGTGLYRQGNGGSTMVDGLLAQRTVFLQGGGLGGNGIVRAQGGYTLVDGTWMNGVSVAGTTIEPGHGAGGLLTIDGDLTALPADQYATLVIDIAGKGASGRLAVTGQLNFYGNLVFNLVNGYRPQSGDSFTWLTAGSGSFGFGQVSLQTVAADGSATLLDGPVWYGVGQNDPRGFLSFVLDGQVEYATWNLAGSTETLTFSNTLQPVPEPQAWMLLIAGLGVLLPRLSRRRAEI
ncbi:beta strand repeat-containing protein [Roseateles sp. BYS78W]|uniref:Beta strand repeat-containing protein n=1 Tax=Pelomonas candidula TaxID=3299025 RepID=A0ABW7HGP8_9BURK